MPRLPGVDLGNMDPQQQLEKNVYMKSLQMGDRMMYARVTYQISVTTNGQQIICTCHKEQSAVLPTINPLNVTVKLSSLEVNINPINVTVRNSLAIV
jgi:hypothetical protein